ncbi:MAG: FliO/MopB family protein [Opitutales bacterium]
MQISPAHRIRAVSAAIFLWAAQWTIAQDEPSSEKEVVPAPEAEQIIEPRTSKLNDVIVGERAPQGPSSSFLTTLGSWIVVFIVFGAAFVYVKKKGLLKSPNVTGPEKALNIVETTALGGRQFLVLARVRDKEVLLGVGQGFISKLDSIDASVDSTDHRSFESDLRQEFEEGHSS